MLTTNTDKGNIVKETKLTKIVIIMFIVYIATMRGILSFVHLSSTTLFITVNKFLYYLLYLYLQNTLPTCIIYFSPLLFFALFALTILNIYAM